MRKVHAVILAAGAGQRLDREQAKQFIKVAGRPVLEHTLERFQRCAAIDRIVLVLPAEVDGARLQQVFPKIAAVVVGGATRLESSAAGVRAVDDPEDHVLVHDAVRPFVSERILADCVQALQRCDAVDVAIPSADTIVEVGEDGRIVAVPPRSRMLRGQTPQGFRVGLLQEAHRRALAEALPDATDDCSLMLRYGLAAVTVVRGEERNIKLTFPEDLYLADRLFQLAGAVDLSDVDLRDLAGRSVVVLGGSRGIGQAVVEEAARCGARVHALSRRVGVDVRSVTAVEAALQRVVEQEGGIDHVVVTAAQLRTGAFADRDTAELIGELEVNLLGSVHALKLSLPHLRRRRGSAALFTSSSYTRGRAGYALYAAAKAAIVNLVQGLAEEWLAEGVRVNAINPERTRTALRTENFEDEPAVSLLDPVEVARATLQTLVSAQTGQVVDVRLVLGNG